MPTVNRALFRKIFIEDFFAELNFMAGVFNVRHPDRIHFTGSVTASLHADIERSGVFYEEVAPYRGGILRERLDKAAVMATAFYGASIDLLTVEQVRRYAISGVDRTLEYLSTLDETGKIKSWRTVNFMRGLALGDARRWVTALPENHFNGEIPDIKPSASQVFYSIHSAEQQAAFEHILNLPRTYSSNSTDLIALDMSEGFGINRREKSSALYHMVSQFIAAMHRHFAAFEHPAKPLTMPASIVKARASLYAYEAPSLDAESNQSSLESAELASMASIVEPELSEQRILVARMALQARLHRLSLRNALTIEQKAQLTQNLQALLPSKFSVSPTVSSTMQTQSFAAYLHDYLVEPARLDTLKHFFKKPTQPLLIQGEQEVSKAILFGVLQRHIALTAKSWIPLLIILNDIDMLAIDLSEPFLPQYFSKGLGYDAKGVANLRAQYQFVFFFDGLDQCANQELIQRIYFGEETSEWRAKLIFTASQGWEPPVRKNALAIQRVRFENWTVEQSKGVVEATWLTELAHGEEEFHGTQCQFFLNNPPLWSLARAFTDNQAVIKSARGKIEPNFEISPVLLNVLYELLPVLRKTDPAQWPTNRHQLYAFGLRHYLGEHYDTSYPKIRNIALSLFQQGLASLKERIIPDEHEAILYNFPFLSGSIQQQDSAFWHRYAFTQTSWRDYLIAEALWQTCYVVDAKHTDAPEKILLNQQDCLKDYPGVMDFLSEFLRHSVSAEIDIRYLKKQWVSNGALVSWENAYANAKALVDRVEGTLTSTVLTVVTASALIPLALQSLTPAVAQQVATKAHAQEDFIYMAPNRAMRIIEGLDRQQSEVKRWVFDSLGHGAGISPRSPNYDAVVDTQSPLQDKRRYMACNHLDAHVAEQLLRKTFACIAAGDITLIEQLVPDYWGLYSKETRFKVSQLKEAIDLDRAKLDYFIALQQIVFKKSSMPFTMVEALRNLKLFKAKDDLWLEQRVLAYEKQCQQDGGWFTRDGIHVDKLAVKAIAKRVKLYRTALQAEMMSIANAISCELQLKPVIKKSTSAVETVAAKKTDRSHAPVVLDKDRVQAFKVYCDQMQVALAANEPLHQAGIVELHQRSSDLIDGTMARFTLLMELSSSSQQALQAYTTFDRDSLLAEITAGDLALVIERFKPHYLQHFYASKDTNLQAVIGATLKQQCLAWLAAPEDARLSETWHELQRQWNSSAARNTARKVRFLEVLETLDLTSALALFKEIIKFNEVNHIIVGQVMHELLEHSVKVGVEQFMVQELATSNAWQIMSIDAKTTFYQRVYLEFSREEPDEHALAVIAKCYPQLFPHFTDDFLIRYLRFGLAVDACSRESQNTLLFYALTELAKREEVSPMPTSDALFRIIQHLFNTGAMILVKNTAAVLNTPVDYVNYHCLKYPNNSRWTEIKTAMQTVLRLFHENCDVTEKALVDLSDSLGDVVSHYKDVHAAEQNAKASTVPYFAHSQLIREHRAASIDLYTAWAQNIKKDLFYLDVNIINLKAEVRNFPSFIFSSRLGVGILKEVENFEKKSSPKADVWSLQAWSMFRKTNAENYPNRHSMSSYERMSRGSVAEFFDGSSVVSARERELQAQLARVKSEAERERKDKLRFKTALDLQTAERLKVKTDYDQLEQKFDQMVEQHKRSVEVSSLPSGVASSATLQSFGSLAAMNEASCQGKIEMSPSPAR